ncbi:hypothetical protein [[Haemophilus] ducreyi]|uniref:hypothetical protein n=1 Tax=Haemophilus ducreyi TaxID=730 RepID=UPI000ADDA8E1|nr:hypothetical protein [[Haemophilus] ducreyi]
MTQKLSKQELGERLLGILIKQARESVPLNQQLHHLKNKEAYENTDQQLSYQVNGSISF